MRIRDEVRLWTLVAMAAALLTLGALASVVVRRVGAVALRALVGDPVGHAKVATQLAGAELALWLATTAVLALAVALTWAALHWRVTWRLESAARRAVDRSTGGNEVEQLQQALDQLREELARERARLLGQLQAYDGLRQAADETMRQLAESDRLALVGRVAMGVAHEVGGPLAIVTGYLERLRSLEESGATLADRLRCVEQAQHAAQRIRVILQDLARPGQPHDDDADRPCDLLAVAIRVLDQAEQHPKLRALQLELLPEGATHPADASASRVEQVLLNLLSNAADATKRAGTVHIRLARDGDWQVLHVDDNGPGVPAELRSRLFDAFVTTKASSGTLGESGWGLGLNVSARLAASFGGSLQVSDSPLGGARFTLRLPCPARQRRGGAL